jgi:2-polyprenyl-3-methyl-5-hydroxy-6-metoxy-1,4-benzoquinol methylase
MTDYREKWNRRYRGEGFYLGPDPSPFLADNMQMVLTLAPGRKALDIACGEGRNSVFLARQGFSVTGLDISEEGLAKGEAWAKSEGLEIGFFCVDLESYEFTERYDLIINFNFLLRDLVPKMMEALNPGGLLFFDSILNAPSLEGIHNRAFLLEPGELRRKFESLSGEIIRYEEMTSGPMPTARLIFRKA